MRSNCFKYCIMFLLLIVYINRGFFVAMPEIEMSSSNSAEINSLLEVILNLAGGENDIDEDGDLPENYGAAKTVQPLIDQDAADACTACHFVPVRKILFLIDEVLASLDTYGTIDHPPEIA